MGQVTSSKQSGGKAKPKSKYCACPKNKKRCKKPIKHKGHTHRTYAAYNKCKK